MRRVLMVLAVAGSAWSQSLTDAAGIIAGTSVGAGAGKKVSEGITSVLQKVDATAAKAAKVEKAPPRVEKPAERASEKPAEKGTDKARESAGVLQVGSGSVVKDHSLVPPPPPRKIAVVPPPPPLAPPPTLAVVEPVPPPPPPPEATPEDLRTIASGTPRAEVLKFGAPAARIMMYDDGHLVEIYRYQTRDITFGVVRLSDGSVSSVQILDSL